MPELIVLAGAAALLLALVAFSVLYARLVPAASLAGSVGLSLLCAAIGAACWYLVAPLMSPAWSSGLYAPIGVLAAIAALLATIVPRSGGAGVVGTVVFGTAWSLVVFVPVAVATFVSGVVGVRPLDHGGSLALNIAAGASALGALLAGRGAQPRPGVELPRGLGVAAVISLVIGWVGWLVAAELAVDEVSGDILVNAVLAGAGGVAGWLVVQRIRHQTTTLPAVFAGLVSGLVSVSAGVPFFSPVAAISTGAIAAAAACVLTLRRVESSGRQQWFIVGSHLVAAAIGFVLLGLLANRIGFVITGQIVLIQDQAISSLVVAGYSAIVSFLLWAVVRRIGARWAARA